MGIIKSIYQIAYATEADKTFRQSIQFWALYVSPQPALFPLCAKPVSNILCASA